MTVINAPRALPGQTPQNEGGGDAHGGDEDYDNNDNIEDSNEEDEDENDNIDDSNEADEVEEDVENEDTAVSGKCSGVEG